MPSPEQLEVYKQYRTAQEQYVYFLLAAVGGAIALAVNQTQELELVCSQIPLGIAVALWGLSFFFGCKHLGRVESTLFANSELLKVQDGEHLEVGTHIERMAIAAGVFREIIGTHAKWSSRFARWQFGAFIWGAAWYLGWHVFEMWLRT